jgi:hypothetical protein
MHPKQITRDYFISYTKRNFSAKTGVKMQVGRMIYAFSSAFCFINFEQKIAEILTCYQSNASRHLKCLKNLGCGERLGI